MSSLVIKEVKEFTEIVDNKEVKRSKLIISDNGKDTEIILEGNGKIRVTAAV